MGMTREGLKLLGQLLSPIRAQLWSMVRPATTSGATSGGADRPGLSARADVVGDEVHDSAEVLEQYGFASVPPDGSQGVLLCPAGDTGHPILTGVGNPGQRIGGLAGGESAVYVGTVGDTGARVVCRASGSIEIQPSAGEVARIGPLAGVALPVARSSDPVRLNATDVVSINTLIAAWNATQVGGGPILALPGVTLTPVTGLGTITAGGTGGTAT